MDFQLIELIIQAAATIATGAGVVISLHQVHQERTQRIERELRLQADRVAAWFEDVGSHTAPSASHSIYRSVVISNNSEAPIYDVIISCVGMYGAGPAARGENAPVDYKNRVLISQINPGSWSVWLPTDGSGMGVITTVEIAFRDACGTSWVRRGSGCIEALEGRTIDCYHIGLPPQWTTAQRVEAV